MIELVFFSFSPFVIETDGVLCAQITVPAEQRGGDDGHGH